MGLRWSVDFDFWMRLTVKMSKQIRKCSWCASSSVLVQNVISSWGGGVWGEDQNSLYLM